MVVRTKMSFSFLSLHFSATATYTLWKLGSCAQRGQHAGGAEAQAQAAPRRACPTPDSTHA